MIRLDRFLTEQNIGSRSEIKQLCKKGVVLVNQAVCKDSGRKIDPEQDQIYVRGERIRPSSKRCYMLNKPAGYVSAVSDAGAPTVLSLFHEKNISSFFPVGRLDKDSEGLLLVTDDGALCHKLTSPKKHVPKTYEVWITGILQEAELNNLQKGTDIGDDTCCLPAVVTVEEIVSAFSLNAEQKKKLPKDTPDQITASRVFITITEGRFHQVKRMFHANRHEVFSLKRISVGTLRLDPALAPGEYRLLTVQEHELLEHL